MTVLAFTATLLSFNQNDNRYESRSSESQLFQNSDRMQIRQGEERGAQTGSLAVLHTWGQSLNYHPHIHMLVPAGGLDQDGMEWIPAKGKSFVPVKALSAVFRGVFFSRLRRLLDQNILTVPEGFPELYADIGELRKVLYGNH